MEAGGNAPTGVTCGRRSTAVKRAKTSRASGPAIVMAPYLDVASTIVNVRDAEPAASSTRSRRPATAPGSQTTTARSADIGSHQASAARLAEPSSSAAPPATCATTALRSSAALAWGPALPGGARCAGGARVELELAEVRPVGPAGGAPARLALLLERGVADRDVPAVARLEPRARGARRALHRAARDRREALV